MYRTRTWNLLGSFRNPNMYKKYFQAQTSEENRWSSISQQPSRTRIMEECSDLWIRVAGDGPPWKTNYANRPISLMHSDSLDCESIQRRGSSRFTSCLKAILFFELSFMRRIANLLGRSSASWNPLEKWWFASLQILEPEPISLRVLLIDHRVWDRSPGVTFNFNQRLPTDASTLNHSPAKWKIFK